MSYADARGTNDEVFLRLNVARLPQRGFQNLFDVEWAAPQSIRPNQLGIYGCCQASLLEIFVIGVKCSDAVVRRKLFQ